RLRRRFEIDMAPDARLVACDLAILGRAAMGETAPAVDWRDAWRLRRGGRLVWADATRLAGDAARLLAAPATGGGARAFGALVYAAPDAADALDALRGALAAAEGCEAAATAFDGLVIARFIAHDGAAARAALARALALLPHAAPPRSWST
ncbi:MAG TPA: urease accessory protein UreD, partial [Beijerinckiaceae bacterium]